MAPLGISVSVLCPGFVRTEINHSERCLPERFADAFPDPVSAVHSLSDEEFDYFETRNAQGLEPSMVASLVRSAIENKHFWIFTEQEFEPAVDARYTEIKAAFDRFRDAARDVTNE